jgi:HK97 family phage major capsid protein
MTPTDIQRAFEERNAAVHTLRGLATEAEGREFTADETETLERANTAIDTLDSRIDTGLRAMEKEAKAVEALETFRSYNALTTPAPENAVDSKTDDATLFRQLVDGEIRSFTSLPSEQRDLTKGSATAGGNLVDSTMFDRIFQKLEDESVVIRAGATVIRTGGGEDLLVPKVTTNPTGAIVAEAGTIGESDPVFGQVTLGAFKYAALTQASQELLADSMFDVTSFVMNIGGQAVTRALGADLTNGSGSSKPKGIMQAATSFGSSATATTITYANLVEVESTMPVPYKNQDTCWIMSPEAVKVIRLLSDTTNRPLWEPSLKAGNPDFLLGYPVFVDGNVDAATSGKRAVGFFHAPSYAVRLAGGLDISRSDDFAFNTGLATFRFQLRGDGDGIDDNGLGCLTQA